MPWSASLLLAPAHDGLRRAWLEHPALSRGVYHFSQLPHCRMAAVGLLAVSELLAPEKCRVDAHIPWDCLWPKRSFQSNGCGHTPPAALLAALSEMSRIAPLIFYSGQTHGGEMLEEECWTFLAGRIHRYRSNPLVQGLARLEVEIPEGGWFEPFTSRFDWEPHFVGSRRPGPTPGSLYQACQYGLFDEALRLLDHGAPASDYSYPNPVTWALRQNRLDVVMLLHKLGHRLNWLDLAECRTAQAVAWMLKQKVESHPRAGLKMLENGCLEAWQTLAAPSPPADTFMAACQGGLHQVAEPLLREHPDLIELTQLGDQPLTLAARAGHARICEVLLAHGARWDESALYEAASGGHLELVRRALEAGVPSTARRWGRAALNQAAAEGHLHLLQSLPGLDLNQPDQYGVTPLKAAALAGQEAVVEWLLAQGVELESRDQSGCTALWSAVACGKQSLVDRLLAAGANPDVNNAYGDSLELLASQRQIQLPARQQTTANRPLQRDHQQ
ncbi:MAG: ankyrin repeat domain-containing protein [Vulcanimicrobiota bacterium]